MSNLISTVPLVPPIVDAIKAEAQKRQIQGIIDTYKALGWHSVRAVEIANHGHPIIALWPNSQGTFTAHINLAGHEPGISSISLFCERALGTFWFKGRHLTPQAAVVIVEALTGKVFETEAVDVRLEQLLEVESE